MQNRDIFLRAWMRVCVGLLVSGLAASVWADGRLNELKKRKVDLEKMAAKCAAMSESDKGDCLAKRQKEVERYKSELAEYRTDLAKESKYRNTQDDGSNAKADIARRDLSIKEFMDYISSCTDKSDRCASAIFQVANLSYQNEDDAFLAVQSKYEKDYQAWEDRDGKGNPPSQPSRDHRTSMRYFERFLKEYPGHKDAPSALVRVAFIADMLGEEDRAFEYLNLLVTRAPDHPLAVQAHLRIGEYWLLKRKYAKAIENYEKVPLDYPGNEAGLALYHRAECYYNMANFEEAARWYYEYVKLADAGKIKNDLRDEAMAFMAACWADLDNGFEVAEKFLREKGNPKWERDIYYEIGVKNKGHDRLDEAVKSFRFLLDRDPTYSKAPIADLSIVEILVLQKKADEAQQARQDLVQRYAKGSQWFQKNSGNGPATEEAKSAIRLALYHIPVYYHQKGTEGKEDIEMLRRAEEGYRNYLAHYSDEMSWDVYQVHQHLAVLYGKLKENNKAAREWKWCAEADLNKLGKLPNDKKGVITKQDAAFNAVIMVDDARKASVKDKYKDDKEAAYRGEETRAYFEYVEWFIKIYGKAEVVGELAYNAAILHYEAKQYSLAIQHLDALITKFPNHQHAVLIRRALAQSLLESGKFEDAEKQFVILQKKLCPSDKQCVEIKKALASTLYKEAESRQKGHDYAGAAQKFKQLAKEFREVDFADKALFEAGVSFDSAGKTEDGVQMLLKIPQEYPKSSLRIKAVLKAAGMYMARQKFKDAAETFLMIQRNFPEDSLAIQSIAWAADAYEKGEDNRRAAQTYESSYRLYPKHEKTPGYLYNAGQIYENASEIGDAVSVYRLLGDKYPASQYAAEAVFSVPLMYEKKGDFRKAAVAYEGFAEKFENDKEKLIRALLGAGKNYESQGNEKKALEFYGKCIALKKKEGDNLPAAMPAEAAYRIGDIYFEKIKSIKLDGTKSQNERKTKGMKDNLMPSIQSYAKAVEFAEEEWALRATMRMGDLFFTIASISDNERIAGLSGDDRIAARIGSKAGVPGYLEKACELYKKNLDVSLTQGIEGPWIDTSGMNFLESYVIMGKAQEELSELFLQVPVPEDASDEEKGQFKQASDEFKVKAMDSYKNALNMAQVYFLNFEARNRILTRLRALDPNAPELQLQVPARTRKTEKENSGG